MENPTKIKIEGLKTIHKLCKFGADHNMEGCSFTEIVERMFDELQKGAVPAEFVLMPKEPSPEIVEAFWNNWLVEKPNAQTMYFAYKAMLEAQEQCE